MWVPLNHSFSIGIFHYTPSILGSPFMDTPIIDINIYIYNNNYNIVGLTVNIKISFKMLIIPLNSTKFDIFVPDFWYA